MPTWRRVAESRWYLRPQSDRLTNWLGDFLGGSKTNCKLSATVDAGLTRSRLTPRVSAPSEHRSEMKADARQPSSLVARREGPRRMRSSSKNRGSKSGRISNWGVRHSRGIGGPSTLGNLVALDPLRAVVFDACMHQSASRNNDSTNHATVITPNMAAIWWAGNRAGWSSPRMSCVVASLLAGRYVRQPLRGSNPLKPAN